jgi:hypothetical protein
VNEDSSAYRVTRTGPVIATDPVFAATESNPTLTVHRGLTYVFNMSATGHPFVINRENTTTAYTAGMTGQSLPIASGEFTWVVPTNAPDLLTYICTVHSAMTGDIVVVNSTPKDGASPAAVGAVMSWLVISIGITVASCFCAGVGVGFC